MLTVTVPFGTSLALPETFTLIKTSSPISTSSTVISNSDGYFEIMIVALLLDF